MNPVERVLRRVDRYQQRHGWLGFLFAVVKKFGDDKGDNLTRLRSDGDDTFDGRVASM